MQVSTARHRAEEAFRELRWRRYPRDPAAFFSDCLYIPVPPQVDPRGRTELRLRDYQYDDLRMMMQEQYLVVLKARQIGLSTLVGAYALWMCLFHPGSVIMWISNNEENAKKAVGMLKVMYQFMPKWAKDRAPKRTSDQTGKQEWTFADGMTSRIRTFAATTTAGASETATLAILDEAALVDAAIQDDLMRSLEPTTDAGGSLWLVSTARGGHNRFAKMYRRASRGESYYKAIFHPWMVSRYVNATAHLLRTCHTCAGTGFNPDTSKGAGRFCPTCVDVTRYARKAAEFADEPWLFHAEYPSDPEEAFRESGRPRFHNLPREEDCERDWVRGALGEEGDWQPDDRGALRIRRDVLDEGPVQWKEYVLYVDTAKGLGQDYTAGTVLGYDDDGDPEILAWWHSNVVEQDEAAHHMYRLANWFSTDKRACLLGVEVAGGHGDEVIHVLHKTLRYPRMYHHKPTGKRGAKKRPTIGLPVSWKSKPALISRLAKFVAVGDDGHPALGGIDPMLREELSTFVKTENGKEQADVGCHDDRVMSVAGALFVLTEDVSPTGEPSAPEDTVEPDPSLMSVKYLLDEMKEINARREAELAREDMQEQRRRARESRLLQLRR